MKHEVSHRAKRLSIKLLTICFLSLQVTPIFAGLISQVQSKTHLRWNIYAQKEQVSINKKGNAVFIKTLNVELFDNLRKELDSLAINKSYLKEVKTISPEKNNNVGLIRVNLKSSDVELFSFYRDREKKHVLDFWMDIDESPAPKITKKKVDIKKKEPASIPVSKVTLLKKKPTKAKTKKAKAVKRKESPFRDFRYGAAFIWDYEALGPEFQSALNLERKTPEHFYPIKDRKYEDDDKEAHLQLSINMYRKKKWGLMYKSIKLFQQKYGEELHADINEYLKANAILREGLEKGSTTTIKTVVNMFHQIKEMTKDYEMRRGITKYLLSYYLSKEDYVNILQLSKKFYVDSRENHDYEETEYAAEGILYGLSKLGQIEQLRKLLSEKTLTKLIPAQKRLAYQTYVYLKAKQPNKVIKIYENNKRGLKKPVHAAILYNTAEAYFRMAKYNEAISLFDSFVAQHSLRPEAANSRLRIALSYEILEKDPKQTLELYKNAINRSQIFDVSYEAKLRYVTLRSIRQKKISEEDRETRVFLDLEKRQQTTLNTNLKKLLWLVRLRSFIVDQKFKKAISYLNAIPVTALKPSERRVFEADGAEIVYGIISSNYNEAKYSQVIRAWELYREKYVAKVASDPLMNFLVGRSYIKLGLYDGFERLLTSFKKINNGLTKTFPIWNKRIVEQNSKELLAELNLIKAIKLKNWEQAERMVGKLSNTNLKNDYYQGIIAYGKGNHKDAMANLESFLSREGKELLNDPFEVAELLQTYTDSIYQLNQLEKFKKVARAILNDTKGYQKKHDYLRKVRERIAYLEIEILAGEAENNSFLLLEPKLISFRNEYKESIYKDRISYLLGLSFVANKKVNKGRDIFGSLLKDEAVSNNIKELVKTELSLLKIKERTL